MKNGLGLCLLKRKEVKFECSPKKALIIQKQLLGLEFKPELFSSSTKQRIANLVFVNNKDSPNNYLRPRIRIYYEKNMLLNDSLWLETREKKKNLVLKERQQFDELHLVGIRCALKKKGFDPLMFVDYERQAFNNFDSNIRITFDSDMSYYGLPEKLSRFKFGNFLGKDKPTMIKIKFVKALPKDLLNIFKGLKKGKSKVAFGKKLMVGK